MPARGDSMITCRGRAGVALGLVLAVAALTGCSDGLAVSLSDPQTVTPGASSAGPGTPTDAQASDPAAAETVADAQDAQTSDGGPPPDGPTSPPTGGEATTWGGGRRVGTFGTRGTVTGDDGTGRETRTVAGTCDLARDVRTVTVTLEPGAVLVVDVTGPNVGSLTLTVEGEPDRSVEYVGDVTPVITLTPTRTEVRGALLVPPAGSAAAPVRIDASFDC